METPQRGSWRPALLLIVLCALPLPGLTIQEDDGNHRNREPPLPQRPEVLPREEVRQVCLCTAFEYTWTYLCVLFHKP